MSSTAASSASQAVQLAYPGAYLSDAAWRGPTKGGEEDAYTDKVGGWPSWPTDRGGGGGVQCACGRTMLLLCQLFVPASFSGTPGERHLWLFGCNRAQCAARGSAAFKAVRFSANEGQQGGEEASHAPAAQAVATAAPSAASPSASTASASAAPAAAKPAPVAPVADAVSDDESGAKGEWSSDEDEAAPRKANAVAHSSSSAAAAASSAAAAAVSSSSAAPSAAPKDEWAASGEWSDDDAGSGSPKKKEEEDDDAALAALLAAQSLSVSQRQAQKAAAAEKAKLKAQKKEQKRLQQEEADRQTREELLEAALAARQQAEAANPASSSSSAAAPPPAPLCTTAFRPFYLCWAPEPAADLNLDRELRLLREYEQRRAEEGEADDDTLSEASTNTGASGAAEQEDEESERREEEEQEFFDRIDRMREQCVRYYGLHPAPAAHGALYSSRSEADASRALPPNLSRCICGAARTLELQLCPNLLFELKADAMDPRDAGMDWTLLDLYACTAACRAGSYLEEPVHVQPPL